jgi:hypothetical protein
MEMLIFTIISIQNFTDMEGADLPLREWYDKAGTMG